MRAGVKGRIATKRRLKADGTDQRVAGHAHTKSLCTPVTRVQYTCILHVYKRGAYHAQSPL